MVIFFVSLKINLFLLIGPIFTDTRIKTFSTLCVRDKFMSTGLSTNLCISKYVWPSKSSENTLQYSPSASHNQYPAC